MLRVLTVAILSLGTAGGPSEGDVLAPGHPAPALRADKWIRGSPVKRFEPGRIYVIEFWAVWCAPCLANFPHLSALQREYADRGVTVVGVSARDANGNTLERVERVVAARGEEIGYAIAWDAERKTYDDWMKAARERSIPRAFVVDSEGKIAFIGHPLFLEVPLARILDGTWEIESGMAEVERVRTALEAIEQLADPEQTLEAVRAFEAEFPAFEQLGREHKLAALRATGRAEEALALAAAMVDRAIQRRHASELDALARGMIGPEQTPAPSGLELALHAAANAVEISGSSSPHLLETLARVHFARGELDEAISVQERAAKASAGGERRRVEADLSEYRKARADR